LSIHIKDPIWAMIALGVASFANDLVMPTSWAACMDVGGKLCGTLAGSMNMMGGIVAAAVGVALLVCLVPAGAFSEEEEEVVGWSDTAEFGIVFTSGNADRCSTAEASTDSKASATSRAQMPSTSIASIRLYRFCELTGRFHSGADFAMPVATPIHAPAAGVVVFAGPLEVRGNATLIDHGWGVYSLYAHQSEFLVPR